MKQRTLNSQIEKTKVRLERLARKAEDTLTVLERMLQVDEIEYKEWFILNNEIRICYKLDFSRLTEIEAGAMKKVLLLMFPNGRLNDDDIFEITDDELLYC